MNQARRRKPTRRGGLQWAAAALWLLASCAEPAEDAADPSVKACADWSTAWCKGVGECAQYTLASQYGTAATCQLRQQAVCLARLAAADSGQTAAQVSACASAMAGAQGCEWVGAIDTLMACRPAAGKRANAQACGDHSQCASGLCRGADTALCGTCANRAALAAPCSSTSDCQPGLACAATSSIKVCVARVAIGDLCDSSHVCLAPAVCSAGVCAPPASPGAACDPGLKNCNGGAGYYCHDQKALCTAFGVAAQGAACGYFDGDRVSCAYGSTCKLTGGGKGVCQPIAVDGGSCSVSDQVPCLAGAVCSGGVCGVAAPNSCN